MNEDLITGCMGKGSLELVMDRRLLVSLICAFDETTLTHSEIAVNESSFARTILSS